MVGLDILPKCWCIDDRGHGFRCGLLCRDGINLLDTMFIPLDRRFFDGLCHCQAGTAARIVNEFGATGQAWNARHPKRHLLQLGPDPVDRSGTCSGNTNVATHRAPRDKALWCR
jgi:hypothetical protein